MKQLTLDDITAVFAEHFVRDYIDGWFDNGPIDWERALDRYDADAGAVFPPDMLSPVVTKLQRAVRKVIK